MSLNYQISPSTISNTKRELSSLLSSLIQQKTITRDQQKNHDVLLEIQSQIEPILATKMIERNGCFSLLASSKATFDRPKLLLASHLDVVDGSEKVFHPQIIGEKLYGRGAFDMKSAIACYLLVIREFASEYGRNLLPDFGLLITTDEEIGGSNGTKFYLEQGYRPDFVFLPDGGNFWCIESAAKGAAQYRIISTGKSAHSSRPWEGDNALEILMDFLQELRKDFVNEKNCQDSFHLHPSLNIAKITADNAINRIPDYCEAFLDIRHFTDYNPDDLLLSKVARFPQIKFEKLATMPCCQTNLEDPRIQSYKTIARDLFGIDCGQIISHGASDAHYFAQSNIPCLLLQSDGGGHHSENEWVDLTELTKFYLILKSFIIANGTN